MGEPSIRMPVRMRYAAGLPAGRRLQVHGLNVDVAPTLLELAGFFAAEGLDGKSFVALQ